jgi:hypothetical protein
MPPAEEPQVAPGGDEAPEATPPADVPPFGQV